MNMRSEIRSVLAQLRARDAAELTEYGLDRSAAEAAFATPAVLARIFAHRGRPSAVVAFHHLTPKALVASMMATDDWPRVARAMLRWGIREAKPYLLAQGYTRAECRTLEGHADAIRLLERLGFVFECRLPNFGATGAAFLQYAWRLTDHVPLQHPQSTAPAAATANAGILAATGAGSTQEPRTPQRLQCVDPVCARRRLPLESNTTENAARRITTEA